MLSIQEVGTQIIGKNPSKFYVFAGSEYGVKEKYIEILKDYYRSCIEASSVQDIIQMMSTKRLVPLSPTLYVVRYDENYISSLSDRSAKDIASLKVCGTIVCLYEDPKHVSKLEKYLSDYTVIINSVDKVFIRKYLHMDFHDIPDRLIDVVSDMSSNYSQAMNICRCMRNCDVNKLYSMSNEELYSLFGVVSYESEDYFKQIVAARNFKECIRFIEGHQSSLDSCLYSILSTMLELEKLITSRFIDSNIRPYVKKWTISDVYNMFMQTYNQIKMLRSISSNTYNCMVYLVSLLRFDSIPSVGDLE